MGRNFGLEDVLFDNPSYPSSSNKKKTTFMNPNISNALAGFQDQNKISGQVKIGILRIIVIIAENICKTYNSIEWCAYFMTHISQKFGPLDILRG